MLGKTTNARFAHPQNPEREKRLLGFAGGTVPGKGEESGSERGQETGKRPDSQDDVARRLASLTRAEHRELEQPVPDVLGEAELERLHASDSLYLTLATSPQGYTHRFAKVAKEKFGRDLDALLEASSKSDRPKSLEELLADEAVITTQERRVLTQGATATPSATIESLALVQQRLAEYPALLRDVEEKKKFYLKVLGQGEQRTDILLRDIDSATLGEFLDKDLADEIPEQGTGDDKKDLLETIEKKMGLESRGLNAGQLQTRRTALRNMLNAEGKVRHFGATMHRQEQWSGEEHQKWISGYMESLRDAQRVLSLHLHRQIARVAEQAAEEDSLLFQKFLLFLDLDSDALRQLETQGPHAIGEALDGRCFAKRGVSGLAMLDTFSARAESFLKIAAPFDPTLSTEIDAKERLASLARLERERGSLYVEDAEKFAAEEKKHQEHAEAWAVETGMRLRRIEASKGVQKTELAEAMKGAIGGSLWNTVDLMHEVFDRYADTDGNPERLAALRKTPISIPVPGDGAKGKTMTLPGITAELFDEKKRHAMNLVLDALERGDVDALRAVAEETQQTDEELSSFALTDEAIIEQVEKTRDEFAIVLGEILPTIKHTTADMLGIEQGVRDLKTKNEGNLIRAGVLAKQLVDDREAAKLTDEEKAARRAEAREHFVKATRELRKMRDAQTLLAAVLREEAAVIRPEHKAPPDAKGFYDLTSGKIFLRAGLSEEERKQVFEHERGHAILHILSRKTRLFPFLLSAPYEALRRRTAKDGESFEQLLVQLDKPYKIDGEIDEFKRYAKARFEDQPGLQKLCVENLFHQALFDELLNRYALWKSPDPLAVKTAGWHPIELELFPMLGEGRKPDSAPLTEVSPEEMQEYLRAAEERHAKEWEKKKKQQHILGGRKYLNGDDEDLLANLPEEERERLRRAQRARQGGSAPEAATDIYNVKQQLVNITRNIDTLKSFVVAYPKYKQDIDPRIASIEEKYNALNRLFLHPPPGGTPPEDTDGFRTDVTELEDRSNRLISEVTRRVDVQHLDITQEPRTSTGTVFDHWAFLSINDVVKFVKDTFEDFKDIYKRTHDRELKDAGETLTKWIGKAGHVTKFLPLHGLGLTKYATFVEQYHTRRYSGAEQEAIEKWKKAMEFQDSHEILHHLAESNEKDQIRAGILLLSERGEMDWNDVEIWRKLSQLSGFTMPEQACLRDDILRDTWLRKLITTIWRDKELYYHWRSENDSKTDSGKKHFQANVDQLSNVGGGMRAELERQLKLYTRWLEQKEHAHDHGLPHPPFPVEVKPHLYEEVIEYAITKGKMTMEDKFYYMVQGVASGLLSIDRLRVLASTHISIFPLIDYFYQKNNTMPFLKQLARRLTEEDPEKRFQPGEKTTLWLHREVTREDQAQLRLSKATSGARSEGIDHEDIPFFITNVDVDTVDNMTGAISGTRLKMSPEGIKNAYVGWNSKFKVFGALLNAEEEGLERITAHDIEMLTQTLIGYIHYDNIVTRSVCDDHKATQRAILSENAFNTVPPSSTGPTTGAYRKGMTGLLGMLMNTQLGAAIRQEMARDEQLQAAGATLEDFVAMDTGPNAKMTRTRQDKSMNLYKLHRNFYNIFARAVRGNRQAFKDVLREYARNEGSHVQVPLQLLNESGSPDLTVGRAIEIMRKQREEDAQAEHGDGAAPHAAAAHPAHH